VDYSINQLAKLSGVTVRTLRFYDEIGLLKPGYVAESGYRYYGEKELLLLQQILFFRELGIELKQIQTIMGKGDFDRLTALYMHKKVLGGEVERMKTLLSTIDNTISHLQGNIIMDDKELFLGLKPEQQEKYKDYLGQKGVKEFFLDAYRYFVESVRGDQKKVQEYLASMGDAMETSQEAFNKLNDEQKELYLENIASPDFKKSMAEMNEKALGVQDQIADVYRALAVCIEKQLDPGASEVQQSIGELFEFFKQVSPMTEAGFVNSLINNSENVFAKKHFEKYHPRLGDFLAQAARVFAGPDFKEQKPVHERVKELGESWQKEIEVVLQALAVCIENGCRTDSSEVQQHVRAYIELSSKATPVTAEVLAQAITSSRKWSFARKAYDRYHPELLEFLLQALTVFAERETAKK
jgi:DNA-binding transcriptional MerR regulator